MTELVQALLELERASSLSAVGAVLRGIAAPLGFDRVLVFATGTGLERGTQRVYWIEGDWFGDGSDTDLARYLHACPVNRHVLDSNAPFFWSKRLGVRGERYQVVKQPRGEGLHGLQVPVFGTTGLEGAVSVAGTSIDASANARLRLEAAATAAFRPRPRSGHSHRSAPAVCAVRCDPQPASPFPCSTYACSRRLPEAPQPEFRGCQAFPTVGTSDERASRAVPRLPP